LQAVEKTEIAAKNDANPDFQDLHQYTYLPDLSVYKISGEAFDLIHKYTTPPDPISYAVWFAYASKSNASLKTKIDEQLQSRGTISRQDIALIYKHYLEDRYVIDSQQNLGLELETNLSDIGVVVNSCSDAYQNYAAALSEAKDRIAAANSSEKLSEIAAEMLEENEKVSKATRTLQADLEESKAHIEYLNQQLEDLQNLSVKDPLTNTSNRRAFDIRLEKEIDIAEKEGGKLSIVFADLDHFKRINDQLGHQIGDVVLKQFANLLMSSAPEGSMVARYGGEEFAMIMPEVGKIDAHNIAVKICHDIAAERFLADTQHAMLGLITASFGISYFQPGRGSYNLLEMADKKLYEAKSAGRNCVRTEGIN